MKLFRVGYVHRPAPDATLQEKVAFVVAETQEEASGHVAAKPGNEVMHVSTHVPNVEIALKQAQELHPMLTVEPQCSEDDLEAAYQRATRRKGK